MGETPVMDLGTIIPALLQNLWSLVPVNTVYSYQRGVKFRFGRPVREYAPGRIVAWFPFIEGVEIIDSAPQPIDTEVQSFETMDGETVTVSLAIEYAITSATKWHTRQDVDGSIINVAKAALTDAARTHSWANFTSKGEAIAEDVRDALNKRVESWGVEIGTVEIMDCARMRIIRLIQE